MRRALEAIGGPSALARKIGIRAQAVSQWRKCPSSQVLKVEAATGVSRHILRPDLYAETPASSAPDTDPTPSQSSAIAPATRENAGHFSRYRHLRRSHFAAASDVDDHVEALREEWGRR
jgi:DNA-binding transcriptional regulator YdaS (Cro superfamily)